MAAWRTYSRKFHSMQLALAALHTAPWVTNTQSCPNQHINADTTLPSLLNQVNAVDPEHLHAACNQTDSCTLLEFAYLESSFFRCYQHRPRKSGKSAIASPTCNKLEATELS